MSWEHYLDPLKDDCTSSALIYSDKCIAQVGDWQASPHELNAYIRLGQAEDSSRLFTNLTYNFKTFRIEQISDGMMFAKNTEKNDEYFIIQKIHPFSKQYMLCAYRNGSDKYKFCIDVYKPSLEIGECI